MIRPPQNEHFLRSSKDGRSYLLENSCSFGQDPLWVVALNDDHDYIWY